MGITHSFKNIRMARRLTFTYFAIISFIIILIHFSVYYTTFESIEKALAKDRFNEVRPHAEELVANGFDKVIKVSPHIDVYPSGSHLPKVFKSVPNIGFDEAYELHVELGGRRDIFYMKTKMMVNNKTQEVWLLNHKDVHEFSRDELFLSLKFQLLISLALLAISLLSVQRVSVLLTEPLFRLASQLSKRSPNDHSPMPPPTGVMTQELEVLLNSINQNQEKITELIERERAFNQHASHELRTPLMVIKGALSLLKEASSQQSNMGEAKFSEFTNKQYQRINQACEEINEFVETLLTLSLEQQDNEERFQIRKEDIKNIVAQYDYLLEDKAVTWSIKKEEAIETHIPLPVLKILLGNLIKNAFSYTENGEITVDISNKGLSVIDTGMGLDSSEASSEGFGLGLVIVEDICRKYGLTFSLSDNDPSGCIAHIQF